MKVSKKQLRRIVKEELFKEADQKFLGRTLKQVGREKRDAAGMPPHPRYSEEGGGNALSQKDINAAKGAAMALLDAAKVMEQAPSHEPASLYAKEVAKQANLIMDILVSTGS